MLSNRLSGTTDLLALILGLLHCLSGSLLGHEHSVAYKTVLGLKLDTGLLVVVNEAESGGLSSSELGAESEGDYELGISLVHGCDCVLELRLWYVCASRMDDVDNHLNDWCRSGDGERVRCCAFYLEQRPFCLMGIHSRDDLESLTKGLFDGRISF